MSQENETLRELLRSDIGAMIESLRSDMNVQFEGVEMRFEGIDARFEGIDARFEGIDARFERIDVQLDDVRGDIAKLDAKIERRTKTIANAIASVTAKHEDRIARLEKRVR